MRPDGVQNKNDFAGSGQQKNYCFAIFYNIRSVTRPRIKWKASFWLGRPAAAEA
jgi:hypothetical protein